MSSGHSRASLLRVAFCAAFGATLLSDPLRAIVDRDSNQQSDIWQLAFTTGNLPPAGDADGDGVTNLAESVAGTNPLDARSRLAPGLFPTGGLLQIRWSSFPFKRYQVATSPTLGTGAVWTTTGTYDGTGADLNANFTSAGEPGKFFRVSVDDVDTDADGVSDWEERNIGFDPSRKNTEGFGSASITDLQRINTALAATNTVNLAVIDPEISENWPDPGLIAVRRTGNLNPITVNVTVAGTATAGSDYQGTNVLAVPFGLGVDEAWISFTPISDASAESTETIVATVGAGTGYVVGTSPSATINLNDSPAGSISYEEAHRFLTQATFGATDAEIASVQALGFSGWIDDQFARAPQYHFAAVQQWHDEIVAVTPDSAVSSTERGEVWWRRAMQSGAGSDPLRQRIGHALSQILVISDRNETLDLTPRGMAGYHDKLLEDSFGNYRALLRSVTLHPTMGIYLSHLRNRKADLVRNTFPDENYAREIMQLFSIGIWMLNPDGTRILDVDGDPISSYTNTDIANFARVFTGLSYGSKYTSSSNFTIIPATGFNDSNGIYWLPMRGFDSQHDLASKPLLRGTVLPVRTASSPDTGAATMADVDGAIDNLFNHPNTGPFIGNLLIQRLVTSNPTPQYVGRVAATFANNGSGVRGDMRAVIKAILLDTEARSYASVVDPDHGVQREPYLRYVAFVRSLHTPPADGRYRGFRSIDGEFLQRPYSSPSVFNFYTSDYQPMGPLRDAGLVAPEFQITNGITGLSSPNRFYSAATNSTFTLNPSGQSDVTLNTRIDITPWLTDATNSPDLLIARLDRILTGGTLSPQSLRNVSRAVRRLPDPLGTADPATRTTRATDRFRLALHLIAISPENSVLQ